MKTLKNLKYDVVCAGGGASGVFAAISAAQKGARVLLLERAGFLGGSASLGEPIRNMPPYRTALAESFICILRELNGIALPTNEPVLPVNGETIKLVFHRMCRENGVDVLLYSEACDLQEQNGETLSIKAINKNAFLEIETSVAVDATKTGSLARSADALIQDPPLKFCAVMTLTGLNPVRLCSNNKQGSYEEGFAREIPGSRYYGPLIPDGFDCIVTVCLEPHRFLVQFPLPDDVSPCDPVTRTHAITSAHALALELFRSLSKQPGFECLRLSSVAPQLKLCNAPSVKRARPLNSCTPDEAIAAVCGNQNDITYLSPEHLLVSHPSRLLVCGALAFQDTVPSAAHSFGTDVITGQAAGICGALAARKGCAPRLITAEEIRQNMGINSSTFYLRKGGFL